MSPSKNNNKKALLIAILVYSFLLLLLFCIQFWPPKNAETNLEGGGGGGLTINLGNTDLGSGTMMAPAVNFQNQQETTNLLQQETNEEAVYINQPQKAVSEKHPKAVTETPQKQVAEEKPTVSKNTHDVLDAFLKGGAGNDKVAGNKGQANGSAGGTGFYKSGSGNGTGGGTGTGNGTGSGAGSGSGTGGGSGSGFAGGYSLGNRKALTKPVPQYTCNEIGTVVVEVYVDKNGNTTKVIPGVRGTTNNAKCLLDQARIAAQNTKWQASSDAPTTQIGKIAYNFSLR